MSTLEEEHGCDVSDVNTAQRPSRRLTAVAPPVPPCQVQRLVHVSNEVDQEAQRDIATKSAGPRAALAPTHPSPFMILAVSFMMPVKTLTFSFTQPCSPNSQ